MIWEFLDETLNSLANWLKYTLNWSWLSDIIMSDIADSPKDVTIYKELEKIFDITPFERKIIENDAFKESFIPNGSSILQAQNDSEVEDQRIKFIQEHGVVLDELVWSTEEIIHLHNYKTNKEKMDRILSMVKYYHKQHFLMSIGVRGY